MAGFLALVVVGLLVVLGLVAGTQWNRWERTRVDVVSPAQRERLNRLESALESLESRFAALQEQQRFLERLLEARPDPSSLPGEERPAEGPAHGPAEGTDGDAPETRSSPDSLLFDTGPGDDEDAR